MQGVQGGDDGNGWGNGAASPRGGGGRTPPPPRRSRSRSPARGRGPAPGGSSDGSTNPGNNLHVSGLSSRVDNRALEELFAKYGRVQKASVMYDPHSRESRGFGFVTMEVAEDAEAAIAGLSGTDLHGKNILVEKARRGRGRTPTPGRYFGPPKRSDRPGYEPRGGYEPRYGGGGGGYGDRRGPPGGGYPDRGGYDDRRRGGYDDRDRRDDRRPYDDRREPDRGRYDDRRYDDRRYEDRRPPPAAPGHR
jgi:transformer-2 protein